MISTFFRCFIFLGLITLLFFCREIDTFEEFKKGGPPVLYAAECHDNLQRLFLRAINSAKRSIVLIIYSLSDEKIIEALNKKAIAGVSVTVWHDPVAARKGVKKLHASIQSSAIEAKGLMHQKILVADSEQIWMGSANFTTESFTLDDNLVIGLFNPHLAETILAKKGHYDAHIANQRIEFWSFPEKGKEGLKRLIHLIDQAKESIYVAMFTWTHPDVTEAIVRAKKRGVTVKVLLDQRSGCGASAKASQKLMQEGVSVAFSSGIGLLHHKFAWIDRDILVSGSANWTRSAFCRNWDCFLILHSLTDKQILKIQKLWHITSSLSNEQHLSVLGQGPVSIRDSLFEPISMAA